jgi:hypothetical protein
VNSDYEEDETDVISELRSRLMGLSMMKPADHPGDYWASVASALALVTETWTNIGPRTAVPLHRQMIDRLIDTAKQALAVRDDEQLRLATGAAYAQWTIHQSAAHFRNNGA